MKLIITLLTILILPPIAEAQLTIKDLSLNKKDTLEFVYTSENKSFALTNKSQSYIQLTIHIVDLLAKDAATQQKADLEPGKTYSGYVADCYNDIGRNCHGLYFIQILDIKGKQLLLKRVYAP